MNNDRSRVTTLREETGFSLIEMLVALTLVALLGGLLAAGLSLGGRVVARTDKSAGAMRQRREAHVALRRLLQSIEPEAVTRNGIKAIAFEGQPDQMQATVVLPSHLSRGALYRMTLKRDPANTLVVAFQGKPLIPRLDNAATETATVITDNIDTMTFRFFGAVRADGSRKWRDTWVNETTLPELIKINVRVKDGGQDWPSLIVAPRIEALELNP